MSAVDLRCRWCKVAFVWPGGRGRYPRSCPECRGTDREQARRMHAVLEDVFGSPDGQLLLGEFAAAARLAMETGETGRLALRRAVVLVAHATGPRGLRAALLALAGVAIRWAGQIPERSVDTVADEAA